LSDKAAGLGGRTSELLKVVVEPISCAALARPKFGLTTLSASVNVSAKTIGIRSAIISAIDCASRLEHGGDDSTIAGLRDVTFGRPSLVATIAEIKSRSGHFIPFSGQFIDQCTIDIARWR
jgi:hypothetical protein